MEKVKEIPLDPNTLIYKALPRVDYSDVFSLTLDEGHELSVAQMPVLFFNAMPRWFGGLMQLRETVAKWIGLKTAHGIDVRQQLQNFSGQPGESIALFHVLGRTEDEILTGENDRHLNFRLSFISRKGDSQKTEIQLATTVQYNGWLGRLYFLPVRPIHRLIVPILLRRIAQKINDNPALLQSAKH